MKIKILFICYFILVTAQAQNTKKYFVPYQLSGKWGYADTLGNIYLKPNYDCTSIDPSFYSETHFIVAKDKKYGVVDNQNRIIIPFDFDEIYMKYSEDYKLQLFITKKNEKEGLYNSEGKQLLETINKRITIFNNEHPTTLTDYSDQLYFIVDRGDKSGIYSYTVSTYQFRELVPVICYKEEIYNPKFIEKWKYQYVFTNNKDYYALTNAGFSKITVEQYDEMKSLEDNRMYDSGFRYNKYIFCKFMIKNKQIFRLELKEGNWNSDTGLYDMDTLEKKPLSIKFKQAFLLDLKSDKWNVPDNIKNILILCKGEKYAILSPSHADKPINYSYTQIDTLFTKELLASGYPLIKAYKDKKWGIVNSNDSLVIPFKYDDIDFFSPSTKAFRNETDYYGFIVKDKDKYFVLDQNHNYLYNYPFTEYKYFQKKEQIRGGFYIINEGKKGIVYKMNVANKPIQLFKTKYSKKYRLEIENTLSYSLPIALIKVYDENNTFLGYADPKGIDYWGK